MKIVLKAMMIAGLAGTSSVALAGTFTCSSIGSSSPNQTRIIIDTDANVTTIKGIVMGSAFGPYQTERRETTNGGIQYLWADQSQQIGTIEVRQIDSVGDVTGELDYKVHEELSCL